MLPNDSKVVSRNKASVVRMKTKTTLSILQVMYGPLKNVRQSQCVLIKTATATFSSKDKPGDPVLSHRTVMFPAHVTVKDYKLNV